MLELGVGADIVRGVGFVIWGVFAAALITALAVPKGWKAKCLWTALALAIFFGPAIPSLVREIEHKQRYAKAKALFDERCRTAGDKVNFAAQDVRGIAWMKWRPPGVNLGDQFGLDDPYGKNCGMEGCIRRLLRPSGGERYPEVAARYRSGFQFVETQDPRDGKLYRYTAKIEQLDGHQEEFKETVERTGFGAEPERVFIALERTPINAYAVRYGVQWDDVSTPAERKFWIAGGRIRIVDLASGAIAAERTGFLFDSGLGSTAGSRSPWAWARSYGPACPEVSGHNEVFIYRVLRPFQGKE